MFVVGCTSVRWGLVKRTPLQAGLLISDEAWLGEGMADRDALAADLERARKDFRELLPHVGPDEWRQPTSGTRWTNEELLFHMVFGYMVVAKLLVLVRFLGRLPDPVSRWYAKALNATTPLFHRFNFYGSRCAARVYNRKRMGAKMDRVIDSLQRSLARETSNSLARGMHFPVKWDPYFLDYMTLAQVYAYPGHHYDHHRRQLTLANMPPAA